MNFVLSILLLASVMCNILQFVFGLKTENNQTQIVQTVSINENHNGNVNVNNSQLVLSNANMQFITNEKGFVIAYPDISKETKYSFSNILTLTNVSNYQKIGIFSK